MSEMFNTDLDGTPEPAFSVNNRLILSAYKKEALKSTTASGFASIQQKISVKGLRLLLNARIVTGDSIYELSAGSVAYIREEYLHTQPWASKVLESEAVEGAFIIVDLAHVEFIEPA